MKQLNTLIQIGLELTSQLDLEKLLHSIVTHAVDLLGGKSGGIYLYDAQQDALVWSMSVGVAPVPIGTILRRGEGLSGRVWESGQPLIVDNYQRWAGRAKIYKDYPWAAVVGAPVRWGDEFLGVINVSTDLPQQFSPDDAQLLNMLAAHVAIALRNARLLEDERKHRQQAEENARQLRNRERYLTLLNDITKTAVQTINFQPLLQTLADQMGELFDANGCYVTLWDEARQMALPAAAYGALKGKYPSIQVEPGEPTLTEAVLKAGRVLVVENVANSPYISPRIARMFPTASLLGLPLIAGDQKLGAALIAFEQPHQFTAYEVERGEQVARQIALAVAKARLYSQLRDSEEKFRSLFELASDAILIVLPPDGRILDANRAAVQLLGYAKEELKSLGGHDVIAPRFLERTAREWERQFAEKGSFHLETTWVRKDGSTLEVAVSGKPVEIASQSVFQLIARDVTERKRFEAQLAHLASHDPLTDLFNRRRFEEELAWQLEQAKRYGHTGALLWLDLDQFKEVNDTLGHGAGDELLVSLGRLLNQSLRKSDLIARVDEQPLQLLARLGGDEFAILLPRADADQAKAVADRILKAIQDHAVVLHGQPVRITTSIGVALFPEHGTTATDLLAHVDHAMYKAKEHGRNCFAFYAAEEKP